MGWFSTFVHTASSVTGWIGNHAGSIGTAAQFISSVLPVVPAGGSDASGDPNDIDDTNINVQLYQGLKKAEAEMLAFAKTSFVAPVPNGSAVVKGPYQLPGMWPHPPSGATAIPPIVSSDIHKFLALNNLPSTLSAGGAEIDVGTQIATQMFANSPGAVQKTLLQGASNPLSSVSFSIGPVQGVTYSGGFVWYEIPMGNLDPDGSVDPNGHVSWHSLLYLWVVEPLDFQQELRERKKRLFALPENSAPPAGPYNASTIRVLWTGASPRIDSIMSNAVSNIIKQNPVVGLFEPPANTGTSYTYQFSSPITFGPGAVSAALTGQISALLSSPSIGLPLMPEVKVIKMSCIIPNANGPFTAKPATPKS